MTEQRQSDKDRVAVPRFVIEQAVKELVEAECLGVAVKLEHFLTAPLPECGTRTHPNGLWMVYFEDADRKPEIFFGEGAEVAARKSYADHQVSWSCHLLSRVPDLRRPAHAAADAGTALSDIIKDFCPDCGRGRAQSANDVVAGKCPKWWAILDKKAVRDCELAAAKRPISTKGSKRGTCEWKPDDDGVYWTTCGNAFTFIDAGPKENKMEFCCYCGGKMLSPAER